MSRVACLAEGKFEKAVIDILLDHNCLVFNRADLLEEEVLYVRSASNFQKNYLNKTMEEKVTIYRILDSRKENFKITGPYTHKIDRVINVITAPEIEILVIHAENKFDDYSKTSLKPSTYVKQDLKLRSIKSYEDAKRYFNDVDKLIAALKSYHSKSRNKEDSIYELILKKEYKY